MVQHLRSMEMSTQIAETDQYQRKSYAIPSEIGHASKTANNSQKTSIQKYIANEIAPVIQARNEDDFDPKLLYIFKCKLCRFHIKNQEKDIHSQIQYYHSIP